MAGSDPGAAEAEPVPVVLGVDVGGTNTKVLLARATGALEILDRRRFATPSGDPTGTLLAEQIVDAVRWAIAAGHGPLRQVAVAVPGIVDDANGIVELAVNLGWRALPFASVLRDALARASISVPVVIGQDVRVGALAEARAIGREHGTVVFAPVGTGLGIAVVRDGNLAVSSPWAGEVGQVRFTDGPYAGQRVEEIASASGVARALGVDGAREVADLVARGDAAATDAWNACVRVLADVFAWTTAVTGCDAIIVGGGLAEAGGLLLEPLQRIMEGRIAGRQAPSLLPATCGDIAGAMGAVHLARDAVRTPAAEPIA